MLLLVTHLHLFMILTGSSGNLHFRHERIKIPPTRYPRSVAGSDRGSLSHSECSSLSHSTPPMSPANLETASFASSQSQSSISTSATQPRISGSPALIGDRRKDRCKHAHTNTQRESTHTATHVRASAH
ncbi:unnamed protein product [Oncorhynchus mykiss]|uniref:Secreted protein n=1 Tax=Oncorhynchus mykiss TaxID=8022 RepID=A0A061A6D5_ONCMY|nr:unnamed protein product [Oncorhynchus mykiss]